MALTDEEFRQQHQPVHVPANYADAKNLQEKIIFALADLGEGSPDQVIKNLEALDPDADRKPVIAATHEILAQLADKGQVAMQEKEGELIYNLHKITEANGGRTNPDKLAPGLD